MADSIILPGSFSLFYPDIEHSLDDAITLPLERFEQAGMITTVFTKLAQPLRSYSLSITGTIATIYDIVLTFADRQARVKRFYFMEPFNSLTIAAQIDDGETTFDTVETPILKQNSDCIFFMTPDWVVVRQIVSIIGNTITLLDAVDRDIPTNAMIGFAFRSRFDQDTIEIQYKTDGFCSTKLTIVESLKSPKEAI